MNQQTLWLQYMQAVHNTVKPASGEALQVVYPYQQWNWGGKSPISGSFSYEQWAALNVVPARPGGNANAQSATSGLDVVYQNWFDVLTIGDLDKDAHYQSLQDAENAALAKWQQDLRNAMDVWKNQTNQQTKFDDWLNEMQNQPTKMQLQNEYEDYNAKHQELVDYRNRIESPVNDIANAYNNADYQGEVTDPNSGKSVKVRLWNTNPRTPWDYVYALTGHDFGGDAKAGSASSLNFSTSSSQYEYEKTYGEEGAGFFDDFIGLESAGKFTQVDWSKFASSYNIELGWQDLKTVTITPEGWYSGADITSYGRGENYATGFSGFKRGSGNYFFGPGGALARIYGSMVVAYRPTVTVDAGESFASYLYQKWETEGGIIIGPFVFGGKVTHERKVATASASGGSFTIKSNDDWPLIVGYVSKWTLAPAT
jgi:hypothetical protein